MVLILTNVLYFVVVELILGAVGMNINNTKEQAQGDLGLAVYKQAELIADLISGKLMNYIDDRVELRMRNIDGRTSRSGLAHEQNTRTVR